MGKAWFQNLFQPSSSPVSVAPSAPAETGDAAVQFGLGLKFAASQGDGQDYAQAAMWYRKAAEQNHPLAQFNLGLMYAAGQGVARDEATAVAWFRKSAEQGDAGAQHHLGASCRRACFTGRREDVCESKVEAYKWFHLAADQGYKGSEAAYEILSLSMSREELTEGDRRVGAFVASKTAAAQD